MLLAGEWEGEREGERKRTLGGREREGDTCHPMPPLHDATGNTFLKQFFKPMPKVSKNLSCVSDNNGADELSSDGQANTKLWWLMMAH